MVLISPELFSYYVAPKPFLKWAGGKQQLIKQISQYLPKHLNSGSIKKYVEPFIGGGALFFWIAHQYQIEELMICDINVELVIAYKTIQRNVEELIQELSEIEKKYLSLDNNERSKFFYSIRDTFNSYRNSIKSCKYNSSWIKRTAQIIFLNKTCFNGLFRVNSKGEFNVPIGRYKKPSLFSSDNLKSCSNVLQKTEIIQGDFYECEKFIDSRTFVYFDPPYRPISKTSNFTAYSHLSFDDSEQLRLCNYFRKLDKKGAFLLLSNSDPKNTNPNDNFFEKAYYDYRIEKVQASRSINSKSSKRGSINELLIMNY